MGCGDECPWVPAKRREDWALPDPKHMDDDGYRAVRDDIAARVRDAAGARCDAAVARIAGRGARHRVAARHRGGSGIMGVALSRGNDGVALLANAGATAGVLYVLIVVLGPISGAHFNPAVTLAMRLRGELETNGGARLRRGASRRGDRRRAARACDVRPAALQPGTHVARGLCAMAERRRRDVRPGADHPARRCAIGRRRCRRWSPRYIFAAYWFTASTSFANPAVTLARSLTQTFAGIRPVDVPVFVIAQVIGMALALGVASLLGGGTARAQAPQGVVLLIVVRTSRSMEPC